MLFDEGISCFVEKTKQNRSNDLALYERIIFVMILRKQTIES